MLQLIGNNFQHCRIANGTAVGTGVEEVKGMFPNFHWGKDPIFSRHSSQILPKGSPLKVGQSIGVLSSDNYHN